MSSRSNQYLIVPYRRRAGKSFPGMGLIIEGCSAKDALERTFPSYEFVRNPELMFPADDRLTIKGPLVNGKSIRKSDWGYIRKDIGVEAVQ